MTDTTDEYNNFEASHKAIRQEIANNVGMQLTGKTYESDYFIGRIQALKGNMVVLEDTNENRVMIDIQTISMICSISKAQEIINNEAALAEAMKSIETPKPLTRPRRAMKLRMNRNEPL